MRSLPIIIVIALVVVITGLIAGCNSLALSGDKKYSVDFNGVFVNLRNEIENEGTTSEKNVKKLEDLLEKYRGEYGTKGSFVEAEKVLDQLNKATSEPEKAFMHNQQAVMHILQAQDFLRTETE